MKLLHDIADPSNITVSPSAQEGYPISNAADYTNFKEWRSQGISDTWEHITIYFTPPINTIAFFGCNFPNITVFTDDGRQDFVMERDALLGTYRGFFSITEADTSMIIRVYPGQTVDDDFYRIAAVVIGNENTVTNIVYPFNKQLINPVYQSTLESKNTLKKARGHNYRLVEIQRNYLDYSELNELSEIKKEVKVGNTFVLFADDGNVGECYLGTRIEPFQYAEDLFAEDSLILEETGGVAYDIRQLILIFRESENTLLYSQETMKWPPSFPIAYEGRVISSGISESSKSDNYSQRSNIYSATIVLDNIDGKLKEKDDAEDFRGATLFRRTVDKNTSGIINNTSFVIKKVLFTPTQAVFSVVQEDTEKWHIRHPKWTFKEAFPNVTFPSGTNATGKTIPTYFGQNYNVPCYYVFADYDDDFYRYVVSDREMESIDAVYRDGDLVDPADYTDFLFQNLHWIQFRKEQLDFSTGLINITADVKGRKVGSGLVYSENPVRAFRWWLQNYVIVSINSSSFDAAETISDSLGLKIGGGIFGDMEAIDIKEQFLLACRGASLKLGATGYEIEIPEYQSSTDADFDPSNMVFVSDAKEQTDAFVNNIKVNYRLDLSTGRYGQENTKTSGKSFGTDKEYNLMLVNDDTTASIIAQFIRNTFFYSDRKIVFQTGRDAEALVEGDIIGITHTNPLLTDARFEIRKIRRTKNQIEIRCAAYAQEIYQSFAESAPLPPASTAQRTGDNVTSLITRDGAGNQTYFYLPSSAGGSAKTKLQVYNDSGTLKVV